MSRSTNRARGSRGDDPQIKDAWDRYLAQAVQADNFRDRVTENKARIQSLESGWGDSESPPIKEVEERGKLFRENMDLLDKIIYLVGDNNGNLGVITALRAGTEQDKAQIPRPSNKRGNNSSAKPLLTDDMDITADSAASSPAIDGKPRNSRPPKMSSLPPKEVKEASVKREDSEAPDVPVKTGKVVFALGAEVAFKPKLTTGGAESDWIQGTVVKVIGEGKSRRYDVQDPEPDEKTGKQAIIRTWASSMVIIPPLGAPLPEYPIGKHVLARYPDTTTFYRAEVAGVIGNEVILKFEGEDDKERVLNVDRRFVLDHRG